MESYYFEAMMGKQLKKLAENPRQLEAIVNKAKDVAEELSNLLIIFYAESLGRKGMKFSEYINGISDIDEALAWSDTETTEILDNLKD